MTTTGRTSPRGDVARLLQSIADLASNAGARILQIRAQGTEPRLKADRSPVTAADEAAEAILCEGLARLLPGVPIVAEEAASREAASAPRGPYFLVDPIDGTRELLAGRDEYTVNIALMEESEPVIGLIYAPAQGALYAGGAGKALKAPLTPGQPLDPGSARAIRVRPRPARLTALVSRSHPDAASDEALARLPLEQKIPLGSSLKFARLAEGEADVYARISTISEWDVAAGHAILAAAGGRVTAPDGRPLAYGNAASGFRLDGFLAWGGPPVP